MKKKQPHKSSITPTPVVKDRIVTPKEIIKEEDFTISTKWMVLFTLLLVVVYVGYSFISTGYYQSDEMAHYLNMKQFWTDPYSIMGNWPKPGWKIIYVLPVLLGYNFVLCLNSLFAATTCFVVYKIAEIKKVKYPIIAFLILAFQPMWFSLSFRNYSEIFSGLLLAAAVLFHYKEKKIITALLLSWLVTIRQETAFIFMAYGGYLLYKKEFIAIICMGIFPIIQNSIGFLHTGDPLYLLTEAKTSAATYKNMYPRQGFFHYWRTSFIVFGAISLIGFVAYIVSAVLKRKILKEDIFIIAPMLIYFLTQCVFNIQKYIIGTSTGGNLRYMAIIGPLVAVLATLGINYLRQTTTTEKWISAVVCLLAVVAIGSVMGYKHNNVLLNKAEVDRLPMLLSFITACFIFIPIKRSLYVAAFLLLSISFTYAYVKPLLIDGNEHELLKNTVEWINTEKLENNNILCSHTDFAFYWDINKMSTKTKRGGVSEKDINEAPKGTIIIWDTHYAKRGYDHKNLLDTTKYQLLKQDQSALNDCMVLIFRKL